ncbi:penicillin acylase family protein [Arsenophonus endosymbiont of Bemisia tabaci]|uniref:penicillin acylase family protein n=1 Tax=Arsenophonus endosymbiont of Bemisia tabaci TaxID=536059 RepID=UPI0015F7242D|nr:penicillin acylase family protein [Arsenophonus endosymbiont of Bemisia tabaci]CAA2931225.1 Acyl-homoserine lactone acylase QuiP [Arsenophonus endosymbiont of Bemisia tabaci Q2]
MEKNIYFVIKIKTLSYITTLPTKTREDVSYALGFIHAQDRFTQMDLMRRLAAGELAELLGVLPLKTDQQNRL